MDKSKPYSWELVITPSGKYYHIYQRDISLMTIEASRFLREYIKPGTKVGLFINLDCLQLIPLDLYNACVNCGGSVFRSGLSDFDRQLDIFNMVDLDYIICSRATQKALGKKISYKSSILIINEADTPTEEEYPCVRTLYDIPCFVMESDKLVIAPGYNLESADTEGAVYLSSKKEIKGFTITKYELNGINLVENKNLGAIASFISVQVRYIFEGKGHIPHRGGGELDSLGILELLITLEENFEISISLEDVQKYNFFSLESLTEMVITLITEKV